MNKEKKQIRKRMLAQREKLDPTQKAIYDQQICAKLEQLILEKKCSIVHSYIPMRS